MSSSSLDRRTLFRLAGASLLTAGCVSRGGDPTVRPPSGSPVPSTGTGRPSPTPSPTPAALRAPTKYQPLPGEPIAAGKQVAADLVQMLTTRKAGQSPEQVVTATMGLLGAGVAVETVLAAAAPLFTEPTAAGDIIYPQLGGLSPLGPAARQAAVMVVVRHRLRTPSGTDTQLVRTMDVRVELQAGQWRVVELASIGGEPVARPAGLAPEVGAVLDDPRIELPDTCRWDIHAGRISADLLGVLSSSAAVAPVAVTVLSTGHPLNVFGTSRASNHTQGRAADLWQVGGRPVVSTGAADGPARAVLTAAAADRRIRQTGSPVGSDLDGAGRRSFTDLVHADHLHLAVGATPVSG